MRWDTMFEDLEGQFEEAQRRELAGEVADRSRAEAARVRLLDRLRAALDRPLRLQLLGIGLVDGRVRRIGPGWLLLDDDLERELLVCVPAITGVYGLPAGAAAASGVGMLDARLGLTYVLRGIGRDRAAVAIALVDGVTLTGTIDRVGADHLDLSEHGLGEVRRRQGVSAVRAVPLSAIACLRRA